MLVYLIEQALTEAKDEALRLVVDYDAISEQPQ
ncbi:hypothetical protein ACVIKO_001167 [Rhizobium ruizarguesonis]